MIYLIMCRSLTYAQRSSRLLERSGITATVMKAPQSVSGNGCGYSVAVPYKRGSKAVGLLREADLLQGRVYVRSDDGELREVNV